MFNRSSFFYLALLGLLLGAASLEADAQPLGPFQKILIADTEAKLVKLRPDLAGDAHVIVQDVPLLSGPDFPLAIAPFIGQTINTQSVDAVGTAIKQYAVKHDRFISVYVPNYPTLLQDARDGVVRFVVVVEHYSKLNVTSSRWFSQQLLMEKLGLKPGDEISIAALDQAVTWTNANPFRHVEVFVNPLNKTAKDVELLVGVNERLPLRLTASYDDTGSETIGRHRYSGVLQYGNLWGLDHQISYQYTTTDRQSSYQAHSIDYRIPLPWRHYLQLDVSYLTIDLPFGDFVEHGRNFVADARYTIPLRTGDNPAEWYAALDFKRGNNDLAYGSSNYGGLIDTFQATTGFSVVQHDKHGAWLLGGAFTGSPGNFDNLNTNATYNPTDASKFGSGRYAAKAQYAYGTVTVQRLLTLGGGWDLMSRFIAQDSSANLLGSEQLGIGGSGTVRGYNEHIISGDKGMVFSSDLMLPGMKTKLAFKGKAIPPLESRFLLFYDNAEVAFKFPFGPSVDPRLTHLESAGLGVRVSQSTNFSVSADYGWQMEALPARFQGDVPARHSRGHVKVVLSY